MKPHNIKKKTPSCDTSWFVQALRLTIQESVAEASNHTGISERRILLHVSAKYLPLNNAKMTIRNFLYDLEFLNKELDQTG